ncbi:MAG: 1,4-alpha-glucan branching protein GlgB [Lachnospiraceae bacterium]|jgi:1,4-alpha-glucan branching enzyme|nr:1,4-alpha-glucan branching protein GlgB [Lachnospiraceae bacterium]
MNTKKTVSETKERAPRKPVNEKYLEFTKYDQYLFGHATHYDLYRKLGAHPAERDGVKGTYFAVWAPNARAISVVGDFNSWNVEANFMTKKDELEVWDTFIPGVQEGSLYKYYIIGAEGQHLYKADPYANQAELRPGNASVIWDSSRLKWTDDKWMKQRENFNVDKDPMVIYECHPGSWMKHPESDGIPDGFYNYREFAVRIADYLKDMNYTHIELMGIAEHPFDGSWGYQVTGYYAPTSRYGTPDDFQYMVDYLHGKGIGVILDWVPAHFPKDDFGLANFDGCALYEHADPRKGEHPEWGTKIFNYGRPEVKNFLLANALYWIEFFHIDGLRVDAVASMLYLDYGKSDGQWVANKYGENKNLEAIEFFKHLNTLVQGRNKGTVMIAEESTAWPQVTGDVEKGGLGFGLKWNMGWMNDFLEYMKLDPYFRKFNHYKLTFSTSYCYSEKYVLVLSHDEVVHLKCSMWQKMPGIYEDKFSNLREAYTFMCGHPGKKLLFMGQDFGQQREWSEDRELDWFLLNQPLNKALLDYVRELWKMYRKYPALYATDTDPNGFEWINADDADRSIYSFMRKSPDGKKNLLFVLNMTPIERPDYRCGVPVKKSYKLILNSADPKFGGTAEIRKVSYAAQKGECDRRPYSIEFPLPAYCAAVFEW